MQKTKRRDREEIMYQILKAAVEPATRTRLIYASFLSNSELRQYIRLLIENGRLELDPISRTRFKVTEEGRKFLRLYEDMRKMMTMSTLNNNISNRSVQRRNMSFH
jgi:predicted transcriptional regulator